MVSNLSRRGFGKSVGAAAATLAATASFSKSVIARGVARPLRFPEKFTWGCATAAYQIEGAVNEDGRGQTNWDIFAHTPGKTHNGDTGDVADDSYHRFKEDTQLLKGIGAQAYRMSIAWARIFPEGRGQINEKGIAHYDRVIDNLLENNIDPYLTLFHWDLPQALPGGWQNRDTSKAFADYAGVIAKHFSDRVHHFFTTNEFVCFTDLGHKIGQFAPGLKLPDAEVNQVRHNGILAHGLAVQAIRANAKSGTQVGMAENPGIYLPVIDTPEQVEAARKAMRNENAPFLTTVMEGKYPDSYLEREGANAPKIEAGDMAAIGSKLDFVGLNVYNPNYVRADDSKQGYAIDPHPSSHPHMPSPWLFVGPEVMYWAVRLVGDIWNPTALYITENGCSAADDVMVGKRIEDTDRVMYLRNHLTQLQRATSEGYPVKGYFLWSLLDNYEWADGYSNRFGIVYVDLKTEERIPKLSAEWYRNVIKANAVL